MKLAVAQLNIGNHKQQNLQKILDYAAKAAASGAELAAFPEMAQGVRLRGAPLSPAELAEPLSGDFVCRLRAAAAQLKLYMLCGVYEHNPGGLPYNTLVFIDDAGQLIYSYRKTHLYDVAAYQESRFISRGDTAPQAVQTKFGRLGFFTCYELRFPEIARILALDGAEMLLVPTAWVKGARRIQQLRVLTAARALENGVFTAAADQCGGAYSGGSAVYAPDSQRLAQAESNEEALLLADIDFSRGAYIRRKTPVFQQRRTELYSPRQSPV